MLRRLLRTIGWILLGLAALCAVLYGIALAINWHDEKPSAAALRLEQRYRDRPVTADTDNAFVYLMGITAPPGADPTEMGRRRFAWIQSARPGVWLDPTADPIGAEATAVPTRPPKIRTYLERCGLGLPSCTVAFEAATEDFEAWQTVESALLQRFQALLAHPGWREDVPLSVSAPLPPYKPAADGQKMLLLQALVLAHRQDGAGVAALLRQDLRFWRRVLVSSDTLISKMIATAAIDRHFTLGNLVLRALPRDQALQAMPAEWRTPISRAERSMQRCMTGEWLFSSAVLQGVVAESALDADAPWLSHIAEQLNRPFFQLQATINAQAEYNERIVALMDVPLQQAPRALTQASQLAQGTWPPRTPYNLVGQILLSIGAPAYDTYARRAVDLEGVRRAALATVTLRAANVERQDVAATLAAHPLHNPYDDRPFDWNGTSVVFHGLEATPRGVHGFDY